VSMLNSKSRSQVSADNLPADPGETYAMEAKKNVQPGQAGNNHVQTEEFQRFYQQNLSLIYRYVYSKVGNREEAEDITSQVFVKAVHGIDSGRGPEAMQKWLFQVARTTIADYWRARYRLSTSSLEELLDAGWEGPAETDPDVYTGQPAQHVRQLLNALPEHYRQVLTCRFLFSLSVKETALSMGLSEANVKVLQFRALKRAAEIDDILEKTPSL
jgi:RNA polymerase sigma-70 factor (ECF subfamily)